MLGWARIGSAVRIGRREFTGGKGEQAVRVFQSSNNNSDEQCKYVECDEENFVACYAFGEWHSRRVVDISKMQELNEEDDLYEYGLALRQARKALRLLS